MEFESLVISQCDSLIDTLMKRKQELLDFVSHERERKTKILKDQAASCTSHLQKTTGLLYFCVEILKESDPTSFLQVSWGLFKWGGGGGSGGGQKTTGLLYFCVAVLKKSNPTSFLQVSWGGLLNGGGRGWGWGRV